MALCVLGVLVFGMGVVMLVIPWVGKFMDWYVDWVIKQ
jgi:hypothetical protein